LKIKSWQLIVLAIIVFILDFFTLGNRRVIDNLITNQIAFVIGLLCVLVFLFGVIKTLRDLFIKNREVGKTKRKQEEEQGISASGVEIGLRRLLGILLLLITVPLMILMPISGLLLGLPNLILGLYLLLNRRYHLIFNCLLVLPGCILYFVTFSGNPSYFSLYKNMELYACPGLISPIMPFISAAGPLVVTKYLFLTAALFLLTGEIITRLKLSHKSSANVISFLIISLALFFLPFLYIPQVALGGGRGGGTSGDDPSHFKLSNQMSYDQTLNTYLFTASMVNQDSNNSASITNICVDGKIFPITKENSMLQIDNGMIADGKITVAPGQTAVVKLVSQKPFYVFKLFEGTFSLSTSFIK
jgi:hypothetical protein